jgi:hypothetical protein
VQHKIVLDIASLKGYFDLICEGDPVCINEQLTFFINYIEQEEDGTNANASI